MRLRRKLRRTSKLGREEGASAILIALLALFVLLPLAGFATSSFIRAGTIAELSLAADAGALAGASTIPVGDLQFLVTYIGDRSPEEIDAAIDALTPGSPQSPRDIACIQARAALASNGAIGSSFDSGEDIDCVAKYLADPDFVSAFGECVNAVEDNPLGDTLIGLKNTLPGLLRPGMEVTLSRGVDPPLEALIDPGEAAGNVHTSVSHARRRFKNAIVLPVVPLPSVPSVTDTVDDVIPPLPNEIPLNDAVALSREEVLEALRRVDEEIDEFNSNPLLPDLPAACRGVIPALRDDFVDVANPPEDGAPTAEEVLDEAAETDQTILVLVLVEGTPFFDFVPVCEIEKIADDFVGRAGCAANAPGAFRAYLVRAA